MCGKTINQSKQLRKDYTAFAYSCAIGPKASLRDFQTGSPLWSFPFNNKFTSDMPPRSVFFSVHSHREMTSARNTQSQSDPIEKLFSRISKQTSISQIIAPFPLPSSFSHIQIFFSPSTGVFSTFPVCKKTTLNINSSKFFFFVISGAPKDYASGNWLPSIKKCSFQLGLGEIYMGESILIYW